MLARNPVKTLGAFHAHERILQSYLPLPSPFDNLHMFTHSKETTRIQKKQIHSNIKTLTSPKTVIIPNAILGCSEKKYKLN